MRTARVVAAIREGTRHTRSYLLRYPPDSSYMPAE